MIQVVAVVCVLLRTLVFCEAIYFGRKVKMKEEVISLVSDFLAVGSFDFAAAENGDGKNV